MSDVFCKDCKHAKWNPFKLYTWYCHRTLIPEKVDQNFVTGHKTIPAHYEGCRIARIGRDESRTRCGANGQFWEPKHKKDLFKFIKHVGTL
jgi:hypothetical protein